MGGLHLPVEPTMSIAKTNVPRIWVQEWLITNSNSRFRDDPSIKGCCLPRHTGKKPHKKKNNKTKTPTNTNHQPTPNQPTTPHNPTQPPQPQQKTPPNPPQHKNPPPKTKTPHKPTHNTPPHSVPLPVHFGWRGWYRAVFHDDS
ncbi:hypothetical protein J6590_057175 [Homalodisca vitripennis]|nr:hypothetical protein J6590_057175 [Homalodisca vitripennis]